MAGGLTLSCIATGLLLAIALLPDFLGAGPVGERVKGDVGDAAPEEAASSSVLKKLARNKRNVNWYTQLPDFWTWYKFYMNTGNQEGVEDLDRIYLNYLQNKHRVEEGSPSFNHYLHHLGEIYKMCADSDDPECLAEQTSKPKAKVVMPKPAPVRAVCDPFTDPYCLFARMVAAKLPSPAPPPPPPPAPVKAPAPILTPLLPLSGKVPLGYYYAPVLEPFLPAEQRAELLRICDASDVECLQYHLRAAYGYRPAPEPAPSYAHLACDPKTNPYCKPTLVQKAPSGLYHLYPTCDPDIDPFCKPVAPAPAAQTAEKSDEAPKEQNCNPLFDDNCNPLTATRLAGITRPVLEYTPKEAPAPNLACDRRYDPYCLIGASAALLKPPPPLPQAQTRTRLGFKGKTKEGYDCYLFYDEGCFPPGSQGEGKAPEAPAADGPDCHPYDPSCGKFAPPAPSALQASRPAKDGVIEPHPDCDPEYDYNCRLRRAEPEAAAPAAEEAPQESQAAEEPEDQPVHQEEPHQEAPGFDPYQSGQGDPHAAYVAQDHAVPRFEDFLRGYADQYGRYDSFAGGYKKK